MPYYDFSKEPERRKKPGRLYVLAALTLMVCVSAVFLLSTLRRGPHVAMKTPTTQKPITKVATKKTPPTLSKPLAIPRLKVAATQKTVIKNPPKKTKFVASLKPAPALSTPKLEFYEMLKKPEASRAAAIAASKANYSLQVAAATSVQAAQRLIDTLKQQHFNAHIAISPNDTAPVWNRVLMGPYRSVEAANSMRRQLEQSGHHGVLLISRNS